MTTTQAKLAAHKLDEETGISDYLSDQMFHQQGGRWVAIVELQHLDRTEGRDDKHVVRLEVSHLEIVADPAMADHVREIARLAYRQRTPADLDSLHSDEPDDLALIHAGNVFLQCETCLHSVSDDTIKHAPDPDGDGAYCSWKYDGTEVKPGQEDPAVVQADVLDDDGEPIDTIPDPFAAKV